MLKFKMKRCKIFVFLLLITDVWAACDPNKFELQSVKECYPESYTIINNLTAFMAKDCGLRFRGCYTITHAFNEAKANIDFRMGSVHIPMKSDICKDAKNTRKITGKFLWIMGLSCPAEQKIHCLKADRSLNIGRELSAMGINGETSLRLETQHENGGKSCYTANFILRK